jgi:flavin-dependent dehydrogenase
MGLSVGPHAGPTYLVTGDAGGLINPFNGEGIAYAMESGEMAADVITQALSRTSDRARERTLQGYGGALQARYGGYYTLGRVFVQLIGNPNVMRLATRRGLPRPTLMRFTLKLLANLTDPQGGDVMDRVINGLSKVAPRA